MSGVPSEQSQQPQQDQQPDDGWGEKPIPLAYSWSFWFDDFLTSPPSTSPPASPAESPRIGLLPLPTPPSVSPPPIRGTAAYAANLRLVGSFSSIQDFWRYFNNLPSVDKLPTSSSLHMMKKGIKPMWEDPANAVGGIITLKVSRMETVSTWTDILLALIGGQINIQHEQGKDMINGVSIAIKGQDNLIRVWTSSDSEKPARAVYNRIKEVMGTTNIGPYMLKSLRAPLKH